MMGTIERLREIYARCRQGKPLDEKHLSWLGDSLHKFLKHECTSIDEAFGIKNPRGGVPWWREEQMRVRDEALSNLANWMGPHGSASATARRICTLSQRYGATAWRFDQKLEAMPERYAGTAREYLWTAFKSAAPMPLGERQVRQIIGRICCD